MTTESTRPDSEPAGPALLKLVAAAVGPATRPSLPTIVGADWTSHFPHPGLYLLRLRSSADSSFIRAWRDGDGRPGGIFLPAVAPATYLVHIRAKDVLLHFDARDVLSLEVQPLRLPDLKLVLRRRRRQRRLQVGLGSAVTFYPMLHAAGADGQEMDHALKTLARWGFALASDNFQNALAVQGSAVGSLPTPDSDPSTAYPRIAIVVHLHYLDLWPELEALLSRVGRPFDLFLTVTKSETAFVDRVIERFPTARILEYPNRGRDVGPFIQLWRDGYLDEVELICKLHGKKSGSSGPRALLGTIWRRSMLQDLIGSAEIVERIVDRFVRTPELGMIGPRRFRLPNSFRPIDAAWGENRAATLILAERIGLPPERFQIDYFAGTMFWVRRSVLDALKPLTLTLNDFPEETGQLDETLQHAMERLFGALPQAAGMTVEDTQWPDLAVPETAPARAR